MSSTALFAGSRGPFMDALIRRSLDAGERCVHAVPGLAESVSSDAPSGDDSSAAAEHGDESAGDSSEPGGGTGVVCLPWGLRSALSARSLVTSVRNRLGSLDRATVVAAPAESAASIAGLSISEIERYIDGEVRSIVFLVRELLVQLAEDSAGGLTLVLLEPGGGVAAPMQSLAGGAIEGFFASVLEQYRESGPPVFGFVASGDGGDVEALADFVNAERTERASRNRGRLQRFGKRTGLRSLFRQ